MKKHELVQVLSDLALDDLVGGADVYDHPCSVAVRAISQMHEDNTRLRAILKDNNIGAGYSKLVQTLIKMNYDPEF